LKRSFEMRVRIEQEYCTGDGLCQDLCPDVFEMQDDGLAHVKQAGEVPIELEDAVLEARAQCAGECIYVGR
jgi:ferredoxin